MAAVEIPDSIPPKGIDPITKEKVVSHMKQMEGGITAEALGIGNRRQPFDRKALFGIPRLGKTCIYRADYTVRSVALKEDISFNNGEQYEQNDTYAHY